MALGYDILLEKPITDNKQECDFNAMTAATAATLGVTLIDWNDKIAASKLGCFHFDKLHPNEHGYALFEQSIKETLNRIF